jgi:hypothetical protein
MARASSDLPVPLSPRSRTVASVPATRRTISSVFAIAEESAIMFSGLKRSCSSR